MKRIVFALFAAFAVLVASAATMPVFADIPTIPSTPYTFTAGSQSNIWTCNSGQSTFQLNVPTGLTGVLTVTVSQSIGGTYVNPAWSYAPGVATYINTITNSGSLTVNLGSQYFVKVADTTYSSGSVTVSGSCSSAVAVIPPQPATTNYPTPTITGSPPIVAVSSGGNTVLSCPTCGAGTLVEPIYAPTPGSVGFDYGHIGTFTGQQNFASTVQFGGSIISTPPSPIPFLMALGVGLYQDTNNPCSALDGDVSFLFGTNEDAPNGFTESMKDGVFLFDSCHTNLNYGSSVPAATVYSVYNRAATQYFRFNDAVFPVQFLNEASNPGCAYFAVTTGTLTSDGSGATSCTPTAEPSPIAGANITITGSSAPYTISVTTSGASGACSSSSVLPCYVASYACTADAALSCTATAAVPSGSHCSAYPVSSMIAGGTTVIYDQVIVTATTLSTVVENTGVWTGTITLGAICN